MTKLNRVASGWLMVGPDGMAHGLTVDMKAQSWAALVEGAMAGLCEPQGGPWFDGPWRVDGWVACR